MVLRPGGVSIEALRTCPGWEDVAVGYKDYAETNDGEGGGVAPAPRAPGMKYKHYSPRARVVLVRGGLKRGDIDRFVATTRGGNVGVIGTRKWVKFDDGHGELLFGGGGTSIAQQEEQIPRTTNGHDGCHNLHHSRFIPLVQSHLLPPSSSSPNSPISNPESDPYNTISTTTSRSTAEITITTTTTARKIYSINIGPSIPAIAHGLFSALRELDLLEVEIIFVESLDDHSVDEGKGGGGGNDTGEGAAVMNRLRKAAEFELR